MIYNNLLLNKKISNQLTNSYKTNQIQNAYIFHGQEGSGKEAHAIEFFAYINCKNPINNFSACKKCNSCIKVSSLQHELLNIILPLPRNKNINKNDSALKTLNEKQINNLTDQFKIKATDPYFKIKLDKANTILLNSIKEIKKNIHLSLPKNTFKLHLILNAEKLCHPKSEPANALLKILEEPAENNFFILIVSDLSKILDTIKSRCSIIYFNTIDHIKHFEFLVDNKVDPKIAKIISKISFGNISYSLSTIESFNKKMDILNKLILYLFNNDLNNWKKEFNYIKDKNNMIEFLNLIILFIRDINNYKISKDINMISFSNLKELIIDSSSRFNINIEECTKLIDNTSNHITNNGYLPLITTGLFFELTQAFNKPIITNKNINY